ncbi:ChbG/HpnK family deacetylase [bacterium]|nr:ChbG/HpnK family deacetylase [bacterium]
MRTKFWPLLSIVALLSACLPLVRQERLIQADQGQPAPPRALIVNADDLGMSDGVTAGIVQAWREGVVTSSSALVNVEGAEARLAQVRREHPGLPIGLHLNVTTGRPVLPPSEVPTLVDARGQFYSRDALMERAPDVSLIELKAELRAQGERLRSLGVRFDHLDYHEGIMFLYTPFYGVVRELAREWKVPVRHPVPETVYGRVSFAGGGGNSGMMWRMIAFGILHPIKAWRMMPYMTPDAFKRQATLLVEEGIASPVSFVDGFFGVASVENFVGMLPQLPPGVNEVAVHPGYVDEQLEHLGGGYVRQREIELAVVRDQGVRRAIEAQGVRLVDFAALRARPSRPD